ncbi:MAG: trypsin-like peptidase domain-containing protein [Bryobacteraceae bacterium]|jgi:putative serine protease PepD
MKLRVLVISFLLVVAFVVFTSQTPLGQRFLPVSGHGPLWSGPATAHTAGLGADEINNIDIYKTAHRSVVNISTTVYRRYWFDVYQAKGIGSGFVIDDAGRILTNAHVIGDANSIEVTLFDQKKYKARLLDRDPVNDLALIQIDPRGKLAHLQLGDSDVIQVGQKVLAIGNPFGLGGTLTTGIVSSVGRNIGGEDGKELEGMIQTDAAINPGNSGGPLLDSLGNVMGINTAIYTPNGEGGGNVGIGFAMPINRAKTMLNEYQAGRRYAPPRLGIVSVFLAGDYAAALDLPGDGGLLIQSVVSGSAAARAGLRGGNEPIRIGNLEITVGGDFIVGIEGRPVDRQDALTQALARKRAGDKLALTIFRNGRTASVSVTLGAASDDRM